MLNLDQRLANFLNERSEIHDKMKPLKKAMKPLTVRLIQVNKNIQNIKTQKKKIENTCN